MWIAKVGLMISSVHGMLIHITVMHIFTSTLRF